jgi:thioredoxin-related protein
MIGLVKKIEIAANLAIIITALLLSMVMAKHYLTQSSEQKHKDEITDLSEQTITGENIKLPDINWQSNKKTLLLALSTTCHFCTDSSPFYERLTKEAKTTHLIAVFPQSIEDSRLYLDRHRIRIDDIRQSSLSSLGVQGTPTLLLVDDKGIVLSTWVGKLSADKEAEVLSELE